ncbi:hypothetical protein HDU67_010243 [Dinochytrium kinnereticum]|nr:hypothetical protein HDU67_010243 [Dinochytrium kinnereticum]
MASKATKLAIAVAKGDGIGPEIAVDLGRVLSLDRSLTNLLEGGFSTLVDATPPVLLFYSSGSTMDATLKIFEAAKIPMTYNFVEMGKEVYLKGNNNGMTAEAKATVERLGILFKGPMETPKGGGVKSINVTARKVWSAYANKRVFKSLPGVETVFSRSGINIDLTLFRENIEDTYGGIEHYQTHDVAQTRRLITRPGSYQIHKMAFEVASNKNAKRITCCHKANIHKLSDGLFLSTFYEIAKQYPHLKADDTIVDDLSMKLVMDPRKFDVIVLPNLQGDIISDLCAGLVGGLGMAPSANLGDRINIFEAVHGTAPDIAGKNLANPTALLISGLMMLRQLNMSERAEAIQKALEVTLAEGDRTGDLTQIPGHSALTTNQFAQAVIKRLPPSATQEFAFVSNFKPPVTPKENVQLKTERDLSKERTAGLDVFIDSDLQPKQLADVILAEIPKESGIELIMISNRGTQVWPTGSLFTEVVNHYRCRLEIRDEKVFAATAAKLGGDAKAKTESDLLLVVSKLAKKARVCSIEMLLEIDGKKMYSLAQGQ